ncbi:RrF2 family transcriptional regulator [Streptomyces cyslabdanicus]|uniref:RrF2 family transcriptional regulator n=1 Tax=Streptomyces cyslabdanicus TaxID=1470456 RepID=UPI0040449160
MAELARSPQSPQKAEQLSASQDIPVRFLWSILRELRQHRLVLSNRGPDGGYRLARPPAEISIADVIRAIDGSLASFRDLKLSDLSYPGAAAALPDVWRAVRVSLRKVLERVTLADSRSANCLPVSSNRPKSTGMTYGITRSSCLLDHDRSRMAGCGVVVR